MSNEIKQTAVEWFYDEMIKFIKLRSKYSTDREIFKQAKEMEKQEMKHWFRGGMHLVEGSLWKPSDKFEEIYNETYGGKK
jgi:hypothetical protein